MKWLICGSHMEVRGLEIERMDGVYAKWAQGVNNQKRLNKLIKKREGVVFISIEQSRRGKRAQGAAGPVPARGGGGELGDG